MLSIGTPAEHRHTTLHLLTTIANVHENLGVRRQIFFHYISENYQREDVEPL